MPRKPAVPTSKPAELLTKYRSMRDFNKTAEPSGGKAAKHEGLSYLIQKHAATRLHYDFRLELDGVLKSWAVTRGPSLNPADKRLAVHVEDHPLEYGSFEGTIPQGQYGGGTVMLWDRGTWEPLEDAHEALRKGRLRFRLNGERLQGEWNLVRMHPRKGEKRENWLLIKSHDEYADETNGDAALEKHQVSVISKRAMEKIAAGSDVWQSNRSEKKEGKNKEKKPAAKTSRAKSARKASLPEFVEPQLATLVSEPPKGEGWIHEIKFDGYRALARIEAGKVQMITRNGNDWTKKFHGVAALLAALPVETALIDGEVVAMDSEESMKFHALQNAMSTGHQEKLHYFAFDLLHLNGLDLTFLPLLQRKEALRQLLQGADARLHYSEHFTQSGAEVLENACHVALEGIVSKRADRPYRAGRGDEWVKSKCIREQEMVIGGFTHQTKHPGRLGALLIGHYQGDKFLFSGKVGTGFTNDEATDLQKKLKPLLREDSPFADKLPSLIRRYAHWVEPKLVAQINFSEWTPDGKLRHPSFQGLREDKPAREVVREKAKAPPAVNADATKLERKPAKIPAKKSGKNPTIAGVTLSHPEKILYPEDGITKLQLAEYYEAVAPWLLAHAANRPISLVRCPNGSGKPCFFQRHAGEGMSEHIKTMTVKTTKEDAPYLYLDNASALIAMAQMGALELHCWGSRADAPEKPDRITFDFDPAENLPFARVKEAAVKLRAALDSIGLRSFLKTTGGKGLHVVVPFTRGPSWDEVKAFSRAVAEAMAQNEPKRYTTNIRKVERKGRIFIDYLRNDETASAIAPYSTRARPGAPVSVPIAWEELEGLKNSAYYTVANIMQRLKKMKKDPWADMAQIKQKLPLL